VKASRVPTTRATELHSRTRIRLHEQLIKAKLLLEVHATLAGRWLVEFVPQPG
jgi:hypothetical protein